VSHTRRANRILHAFGGSVDTVLNLSGLEHADASPLGFLGSPRQGSWWDSRRYRSFTDETRQ
jgi:hypothetical protein